MKMFPIYPVVLTVVFAALDIAGKLNWSWWQIALPILITVAVALLAVAVNSAGKDKP